MIRKAIQRMQAYVPGEQPRATDVVKLNTNENPYPPTRRVCEALREFTPELLRRYPDPACRALREALAALHGCRPEQIFVGNGSDEVLTLCTRAFVEPEGAIGWWDPSYSLYPVLTAIQDVRGVAIPLEADFSWPLAAGAARVAAERCGLFFFTNPNAPTGMQCPRAAVEMFVDACAGTVVVLDEAYVDFAREHHLALALERENVLVLRTFSKSYSLAGLRVGYAVGPEALIAALDKVKDSYNVDALAQRLAVAAVEDAEDMRAQCARVVRTRERLRSELERRGWRVVPSETNFLWTEPHGASAAEWLERLRARHIYVRHFRGARTERFLRISVGTEEQTDRLLAVVDEGR